MDALNKLLRKLPTGWAEEAESMDETQLRNVIVDSENNIRVTRLEMEMNEGFQSAKEGYKQVVAPFKDALKAQSAKIEYALFLLEGKGKL